ncbi:integron [Methylobacterium sp. J-072]|uniref:integron n=1 Tax=Methylobacterium sp. J-072 TaxID=2836651 RepID=UPI001FBAFE30|nr:integron [Methylobacterium sp. J-072]MCJ2092174.1 integron [Methylobacterium sp. J-072]
MFILAPSRAVELPTLPNIRQFDALMPSIVSRLALLLALMLPCTASADTAPLNVPILMHGAIGDDACPEKGHIVEVGSEPDSFLAVQSGPGETPFREIGRLHDGDMVVVCEKLGLWLGVVYGSALLGCRTTILVPVEQQYTGPCEHGWVLSRNVSVDPK